MDRCARERYGQFLQTLVNIDSGSYDKAGVDAVAAKIIERYRELGFEIEIFTNETLGNNYRIRHQDAENPEILILAHLDTVFSKGTVAERPFSIEGDRAYGPGVIDMKASHVLVYYAIRALYEAGNDHYKMLRSFSTVMKRSAHIAQEL